MWRDAPWASSHRCAELQSKQKWDGTEWEGLAWKKTDRFDSSGIRVAGSTGVVHSLIPYESHESEDGTEKMEQSLDPWLCRS